MQSRRVICGSGCLLLLVSACLRAAEPEPVEKKQRNVDGIKDNSFLIEEAYNQEKGVVQHIFNGFYNVDRQPRHDVESWDLSFTQEWPVLSQDHQLSYTIPYSVTRTGGHTDHGFRDVLLNYRYQAYYNERTLMALAPRASLILPTGDSHKDFGEDTVGCQFNLPFSTAIGDDWFLHLNTGLTFLPDAASAQHRDLLHYNFGASGIYAFRRDLNFMLEWVAFWNQVGEPGRPRDRELAALISPGFRKAFNFSKTAQLVIGLAAPVGLTGPAPDYGLFLYLSFEHAFAETD